MVNSALASGNTLALASALSGLRVLDLSGPMGNYCGKLYADMGAEVILVEPPTGTRLRFEPPFLDDIAGIDRSLAYTYYNTSKLGITLNIDTLAGQDLLRRLAATADLIIETEKPGAMERRGLGYEALNKLNPRLSMLSITPFGLSGPYAHYEGEDLIGLALGGLLQLGGYPDAAPTRVYGNQAYLCANMYGAVASMAALFATQQHGAGDHIDVAMQECVVLALENSVQFYDLEGKVRARHAGEQRFAGTGVFDCGDGYIFLMAAGVGANKFWSRSLEWFKAEQIPGTERLLTPEWNRAEYLETPAAKAIFSAVFGPWAQTKTKAYLYQEGQRRRIPIAPVNAPADLLKSRQLEYRKYFVPVMHALRAEPLLMPGAPYKLSATPWRIQRPAPRLGEHNEQVLRDIGVEREEIARLYSRGII